jgi:hypothetical protein
MATQTFSYVSDAYQEFVVPSGVSSIDIECWGAEGRTPGANAPGGLGGYIKGTIAVTAGETLRVFVGKKPTGSTGGWPDGGDGRGLYNKGGGGGGSSDVRRTPYALSDRLIVAGGGGGGSYQSDGGGGGYPTGVGGETPPFGSTASTGGTQLAGGSGGVGSPQSGVDGALGNGGDGATTGGFANGGGGGGGGYYGGGGGAPYGGGGGGSSSVLSGTLIADTSATNSGNGQIVLTWTPVTTVSGSQASESTTATTASTILSTFEGTQAVEQGVAFASIQVSGNRAVEVSSANLGTFLQSVPLAPNTPDTYKFNVLDVDSQHFASSVGQWRPVSSNAVLTRTAENARVISPAIESLAYDGGTAYALQLTTSEVTTASMIAVCGWPGTFSVEPGATYRVSLYTRAAAAGSRTATLSVYFYNSLQQLVQTETQSIIHESSAWEHTSFFVTTGLDARSMTLSVVYDTTVVDQTITTTEAFYISRVTVVDSNKHLNNTMLNLVSDWIPDFLKAADEAQDVPQYPMRRFLHAATWYGHDVLTMIRRLYFEAVVDGGDVGDTSDLFDPGTANDEWLLWIAQLLGIQPLAEINTGFSSWANLMDAAPTWVEWEAYGSWLAIETAFPEALDALTLLRRQIANGVTGYGSGSTRSMIEMVRLGMIESAPGDPPPTVEIIRHPAVLVLDDGDEFVLEDGEAFVLDEGTDHNIHMWNVLITTYESETILSSDEIVFLANLVKPAGVKVFHEFIEV